MPLKNCDYLVSEGSEIIFNGTITYLPGDMCFTLEGNDLKEVQKMKANPFNCPEEFAIKVTTTKGVIRVKVSDLLTML